MQIETVSPADIQPDFSFCFTSETGMYSDKILEPLTASMAASGIQTPLWTARQNKGFILLNGFKRFASARLLGLDALPVMLRDITDLPRVLHEILLEQQTRRPFSLIHKSRILHIAQTRCQMDFSHPMTQKIIGLLELPCKDQILNQILQISNFHPDLKNYIEKYDLSLKQIQLFFLMDKTDQEKIARLGFDLQIRGVELIKMAEWMFDIVKRDQLPLASLFHTLSITQLMQQEIPRNEKINRIKTALMTRRFPEMTRVTEDLNQFKKELHYPASAQISWDKLFEMPGIHIHALLKNESEIHALRQWLSDDSQLNILKQMTDRT